MPSIDIFHDDAFSLSSLTAAINDQPHVPGRITSQGLFAEEGITTTTVQIEKDGDSLALGRVSFSSAVAQAMAASTTSQGRHTSRLGIRRRLAACSMLWCVGPSSPRPMLSCVKT